MPTICTSCQLGKSCKLSFALKNKIEKEPLIKIHCDLGGLAPVASSQHMKYYVLFVDDNTRYTWLHPIRMKSEFFEVFLKIQKMVEKQFSKPIKIFQCDGSGEFISNVFIKHLESYGIIRQMSCPNTLEQNGISERKHRHMVEIGLTLLFHAKLPLFLWVEAFLTVVFLINRLPSSVLKNEIPFAKLYGTAPDYNSLKVFGCRCYPYLKGQTKFAPKTYPCVFIGYSSLHKGYRCYQPSNRRVFFSRHVIFDEQHSLTCNQKKLIPLIPLALLPSLSLFLMCRTTLQVITRLPVQLILSIQGKYCYILLQKWCILLHNRLMLSLMMYYQKTVMIRLMIIYKKASQKVIKSS